MNRPTYLHIYQEDSVYGHAVSLVREYGMREGVHIDLGCGYGAIAEPLRELGLTYVGCDVDPLSLEHLQLRSFESCLLDLCQVDTLIAQLEAKLAGRPLASISLLDTLEHITNGPALLDCLREFVQKRSVLLIVSVPNGAHHDLSLKLLAGHWDYTVAGLLDHTHVIHHTNRLLDKMARQAGWHEVGRQDFHREKSDQAFPYAHPLLSPLTPISKYLRRLRDAADEFGTVNQFVRAYLPGMRQAGVWFTEQQETRPFLTVVMRTQGKRLGNLRDALLCLTAQTCEAFEVIVVAHKVEESLFFTVKRIIEDLPASLRERTRLLQCDRGNRTAPLNDGFAAARGHYVSILDDDELVFAHWVESFQQLSEQAPGCVLRATCSEQDILLTGTRSDGALSYRAISAITTPYPAQHNFIAHLSQNYSPICSLAFPRASFQDLGIRFDESVETAEDWDFEMRTAFVCGVQCSAEITSIYRKWRLGESSLSVHTKEEWQRNYDQIVMKSDAQYHIFPPGTVRLILEQQNWIRKLEGDVEALRRATRAEEVLKLEAVTQLGEVTRLVTALKLGKIKRFFIRHPRLYRLARRSYDRSRLAVHRIGGRVGLLTR